MVHGVGDGALDVALLQQQVNFTTWAERYKNLILSQVADALAMPLPHFPLFKSWNVMSLPEVMSLSGQHSAFQAPPLPPCSQIGQLGPLPVAAA